MRTVIFLGLIYIGDAIGKPTYVVEGNLTVSVIAIVLLVAAIMDVVDFFTNKVNK